MKTYIGFLLVALNLVPALAQSNYDSELSRLRKERDKALAAAADPIDRRYRAALEQLLSRATKANDLDNAVKIKKALDAIAASTLRSLPVSEAELREFLIGSRWTLDGQAQNTYEFQQSGVYKSSKSSARYVVTGPRRISIVWSEQLKIDCEFDETFSTFKELGGNNNVLRRVP